MSEYAALAAIDWADQKHAVSLYDEATGQYEQTIIPSGAAGATRQIEFRRRYAGISAGL